MFRFKPHFMRRAAKAILVVVASGMFLFAVFAVLFDFTNSSAQPNFRPIHTKIPEDLKRQQRDIKHYSRAEESTYLTFPEWYLVFAPQEYGRFISTKRPSAFPYFTSIKQFWFGYGQVYGITKRHYELNVGDHLMLIVIGTSSSVEYAIKGVYENTVGRLSEWISGGERTEEDEYAAQAAVEYGEFITTDPWFQFPFGEKFVGVWSQNRFWGRNWLRKMERRIFLSAEYGIKAIYGWVIGLSSESVYGVADSTVYATVTSASDSIFDDPRVKEIKDLGGNSFIITLPHYQGFTEVAPLLARQGVQFIDIAGADEILLSVIAPTDWDYRFPSGSAVFAMPVLTDEAFKRVAIQAPVQVLTSILVGLEREGVLLEHIYDY